MPTELGWLAAVVTLFWLAGLAAMLGTEPAERSETEWFPSPPRPRSPWERAASVLAWAVGVPLALILFGPPMLVAVGWKRARRSRATKGH